MATIRKLGWSGAALIDGVRVMVTSGSFSLEKSPGFVEMVDIERDNVSRSKVVYSDGVTASNGNISFDISSEAMALFTTSRLFQRYYKFDVVLNDGNIGYLLEDCYANSVSLSSSVGSLISGSISFVSKNKWTEQSSSFVKLTQIPMGYWFSGDSSIQMINWTFNYNQDAQVMFLNQKSSTDRTLGKYVKCGKNEYTLSVATYNKLTQQNKITIGSSTFTLTGINTSETFDYGGQSDLSTYSYNFTTATSLSNGAKGIIIS